MFVVALPSPPTQASLHLQTWYDQSLTWPSWQDVGFRLVNRLATNKQKPKQIPNHRGGIGRWHLFQFFLKSRDGLKTKVRKDKNKLHMSQSCESSHIVCFPCLLGNARCFSSGSHHLHMNPSKTCRARAPGPVSPYGPQTL